MEKLTLVKFIDDDTWYEINEDDIIESVDGCEMKVVPEEIVKKYNIKENDKKEDLIKKYGDEFIEVLEDCDYVRTYEDGFNNYIVLNDIDLDAIYFDNCTDEFYLGSTIFTWDFKEFYRFWDGSNWKMFLIEEKKEVEAELLNITHYDTGNKLLYKTKDGTKFTIDCSHYQGSINYIVEDDIF